MGKSDPALARSLVKLADGTVKQKNQLTGTEVWTVPGRGHRPLAVPAVDPQPLTEQSFTNTCAFCSDNYLATPPEKSRVLLDPQVVQKLKSQLDSRKASEYFDEFCGIPILNGASAEGLFESVADFRRIPNLFEIVSYQYWQMNHGHQPSLPQRQRMAQYLSSPAGYDHILQVVKAKLTQYGLDPQAIASLSEAELLGHAHSFFSNGHDVIVARRHYRPGAKTTADLASSGTLTPQEHFAYLAFTIHALRDLYQLNPQVKYVATFQNWLKPAGASFDHLHKQLVAIDEYPVQIAEEKEKVRHDPQIYETILSIRASRSLVIAQNRGAVAMAGIGHRYPTIAIWPLGPATNPWEAERDQIRDVSDLLHAIHAATGADVPCNEEWYHRPPSLNIPLRWRILLKWRISTLAGFEGGTRIYLNTIDPWGICQRLLPRLQQLREAKQIAPMLIGSETHITPKMIQ